MDKPGSTPKRVRISWDKMLKLLLCGVKYFFNAYSNNFHNTDQRKTYFSKKYGWQGWMRGRIDGGMDRWIEGGIDG